VNWVKRGEVDRVTPRHTKMRHLPLEDGLAAIPLGPLSVVYIGMSVAEIVERQQVSAPEVIGAQMVEEGHPRIVAATAPTRATERHIGAGCPKAARDLLRIDRPHLGNCRTTTRRNASGSSVTAAHDARRGS
jgi:hypothetical protein